jgi:hypothetical protein
MQPMRPMKAPVARSSTAQTPNPRSAQCPAKNARREAGEHRGRHEHHDRVAARQEVHRRVAIARQPLLGQQLRAVALHELEDDGGAGAAGALDGRGESRARAEHAGGGAHVQALHLPDGAVAGDQREHGVHDEHRDGEVAADALEARERPDARVEVVARPVCARRGGSRGARRHAVRYGPVGNPERRLSRS